MPLVYRLTKGSPLTHAELDGNFQFLTGSINSISGAYATTGSNTFIGDQVVQGNLSVFGTASFTYTTSSVTTISASTFGVSISSPTIRYGFYEVLDSGASIATSSLAWDSTNKYWVYRNVTGSVTSSAILLTGPVGTGGLGTEASIPQYRVPMSNGNQSLVSSNIYTSGSLNIITGSLRLLPFAQFSTPALGTGSGGFFLGGDNGAYGLYMGISSSGDTWIQSNRNDNLAAAYNILIQPVGGNVSIGKVNLSGAGPKLDISGSTVITGSLSVSQGITGSLLGTSSYALFALTASHATNVPVTSSYALQALSASFATTASYVLNAVSSSFATTASYVLNAVSASIASTASFLRPLSQSVIITGSVTLTGSFNTRNTATTTTFTTIGRSGSLYIDLNGVGSNYIDGNILFIRNSAGTTNLVTVSGSTTTISTNNTTISGLLNVSSPATFNSTIIATGSLGIGKAQGGTLLLATSSISSSVSSSNEPTTASFVGVGFLNTNIGGFTWNSSFDVYYAGVSGGDETQLSPVFTASFDNNLYNDFTFGFTPRPQITLSPGGTITSYKMYVYDSGSSQWYVKSAIDENSLLSGITVTLSGPTISNFGIDLVNTAGFNNTSDPTGNVNTITYVSSSTSTFTSSLVEVNAPFTVTGSVGVSGSTIIRGDTTVTGSLNLTGSFFVNGQKQFNYISLFHTASISPTQNVSGSFIYSTVATSSGISLTNNSRITFANTGLYNLQFSAQLFTQTGATVDIWFKKNGVNITNSGTKIGPTSNNTYHVPAWNFMDTFESGSYIEIAYQTDQTNTQFIYVAATGNIPSIPSIIATVTQVA